MPRPRNSSYKSYNLIYNALTDGPKYFEQLKDATGLHRNTVASRLRFLESEGLVRKERRGNKVYYEAINRSKWDKYLISKKRVSDFKRNLKRLAREHVRSNELRREIFREISQFHEDLDELIELQESQEILELIPNWQEAPITKLYMLLHMNKFILCLNSHRQICPQCLCIETITDRERNEVICSSCGYVIEDEIIPAERRLEIILKLLKEYSNLLQ